jgi:hypothetical protein
MRFTSALTGDHNGVKLIGTGSHRLRSQMKSIGGNAIGRQETTKLGSSWFAHRSSA